MCNQTLDNTLVFNGRAAIRTAHQSRCLLVKPYYSMNNVYFDVAQKNLAA